MAERPPNVESKNKDTWDGKTRFVVYAQVVFFVLAWSMAMGRLIADRFWNKKLNQETLQGMIEDDAIPKAFRYLIEYFSVSKFQERYIVYFPHIIGASIWWGFYFLQLIPSIRQKYKRFHRILGRLLMVAVLCQIISGIGLAYLGKSSTFAIISYLMAISIGWCVYNAWYYAYNRDIPRHKYWALRMVGYLQSTPFGLVVTALLFLTYYMDWLGLYPPFDPDDGTTLVKVVEDGQILAFAGAVLVTEWYLAGYYGWSETAIVKEIVDETKPKAIVFRV